MESICKHQKRSSFVNFWENSIIIILIKSVVTFSLLFHVHTNELQKTEIYFQYIFDFRIYNGRFYKKIMGSSCCKGDTVQGTELKKQRSLQDDFLDKYPNIAKLLDQEIQLPKNWNIDKFRTTEIKGQGVFLGKKNVVTRNGYGIMLYELQGEALYYIGYWHCNCKQGMGIMVDNYGSYYKGQWYNDQPNGYGEYYDTKNKRFYKGKWKNGKKEGLGQQGFPDQTKFVGSFRDDLKHGDGKLFFKQQGCYFEGKFQKDKIVGIGKQRGLNYEYKGPWVNGYMQGAGRCTYFNEKGKVQEQYVGQFKEGQKHGYGEYRWANGSVYKGQWDHGTILNIGVFIQAN